MVTIVVAAIEMQIATCKDCCGVLAANVDWEYPSQVGKYVTESLSWQFQCRLRLLFNAKTEFGILPAFQHQKNVL